MGTLMVYLFICQVKLSIQKLHSLRRIMGNTHQFNFFLYVVYMIDRAVVL